MRDGSRRFEEWLRCPVDEETGDPRCTVRRLAPHEFDRVYDLVDAAFGSRRRREVFDWLYRRNPNGFARCWAVLERRGGRLLCAGARFPWPLALGDRRLDGLLVGDLSVAPGEQRQGIADLRRKIRLRHPLIDEEVYFGWPNPKSVRRSLTKRRAGEILGPFPEAVLSLRGPRLGAAAAVHAWMGDRVGSRGSLRVEPMERFESAVEEAAASERAPTDIWSPRNAGFLDWRYLQHPTHEYRAFARLDGDRCRGYAVVRLDGRSACLMELVAACEGDAAVLLGAVRVAARQAGCARLTCFASPAWRHWAALVRAGFALRLGSHHLWLEAFGLPETGMLRRWQLAPGDADDE
jgi:hypothetical protein